MRELDDVCASRRLVLRALAAAGGATLLPGLLVACSDSPDGGSAGGSGTGRPSGPTSPSGSASRESETPRDTMSPTESPAPEPDEQDPEAPAAEPDVPSGPSVPASDVPVGQARVVAAGENRVVVAQPTAGQFVAYSAACTHVSFDVEVQEGLRLQCPAHGSQFDAADGSVLRGPAGVPLATVPVALVGDRLVIG